MNNKIDYRISFRKGAEEKVLYYMSKYPSTEYSGILFYKVLCEGASTKMEAIDFLLYDIGSTTFTVFEEDEDITSYMVNNPALLENGIQTGLLHSHHSMKAFFSGTDDTTLRNIGEDRESFLSVVVSSSSPWVAKLARRVHVKEEIKATENSLSLSGNNKNIKRKYTREYNKVDIFEVAVEHNFIHNKEWDERIDVINKKKSAVNSTYKYPSYSTNNNYNNWDWEYDNPYSSFKKDYNTVVKASEVSKTFKSTDKASNVSSLVDSIAKKLLTCCIYTDSKNTVQEVFKRMEPIYKKTYIKPETLKFHIESILDILIVEGAWKFDDNLLDVIDELCTIFEGLGKSNDYLNLLLTCLEEFKGENYELYR